MFCSDVDDNSSMISTTLSATASTSAAVGLEHSCSVLSPRKMKRTVTELEEKLGSTKKKLKQSQVWSFLLWVC